MTVLRSISSTFVVLAMVIGLVAGCDAPKASDFKPSKLFSMKSSWPWGDENEPEKGTPVRIVGTWTDTVLSEPGKKPQRGFGGRMMFYGAESDKPILVDGQLVVYAFDESGREPTDSKPTRRYVFPPEQVPLHMSKSDFGASYSFWLPWDEAGGPRAEVSLICRFEPKGGAVVTSEQTRHLLPGSIPLQTATAVGQPPPLPEGIASRPAQPTLEELRKMVQRDGGAQLASYETPADPSAATAQSPEQTNPLVSERRMSVTSIKLPANYQLPAGLPQDFSATAAAHRTAALPQSVPQTVQHQPVRQGAPSTVAPAPAVRAAGAATPVVQPLPAVGFGTIQLPRPQLVTPQAMTFQPAVAPTGTTPTVNYPATAAPSQPAVR